MNCSPRMSVCEPAHGLRLGIASTILLWVALALCSTACDKSGHPSKAANDVNGLLAEPGQMNTAPNDAGKPRAVHQVNKTLGEPGHINTSPQAGEK